MPLTRTLSVWDKIVLLVLDRLIVSSPGSGGWFTLSRIKTYVVELEPAIATASTVKNYLDRFVGEGIVEHRTWLWWPSYTFKHTPEVTRLRHMLRMDILHNATFTYSQPIQEVFERAIRTVMSADITHPDAFATETICDSVEAVYNRRLAKRFNKKPLKSGLVQQNTNKKVYFTVTLNCSGVS